MLTGDGEFIADFDKGLMCVAIDEHCGETKTEMRGMVSAKMYWASTKK